MDYVFLIILLVFMIAMLVFQSRKAKKQTQELQDFRAGLQPGTEVITIGGVIGKVVSVDEEFEEIVIDSEGSHIRFAFKAISKEYVRPAYVHDDEVDENGNPLASEPEQIEGADADNASKAAAEPAEATAETTEAPAEPAQAEETIEAEETVEADVEDAPASK